MLFESTTPSLPNTSGVILIRGIAVSRRLGIRASPPAVEPDCVSETGSATLWVVLEKSGN